MVTISTQIQEAILDFLRNGTPPDKVYGRYASSYVPVTGLMPFQALIAAVFTAVVPNERKAQTDTLPV